MNPIKYDPIKYAVPTGTRLSCKGWIQEAALRVLLNNLKSEAAESPDQCFLYGAKGLAARNFPALDAIISALKILENDETLLVQNGRLLGIMKTHQDAARVLISNSLPDPNSGKREQNEALVNIKLTGCSNQAAGYRVYMDSQDMVLENYETYAIIAAKYFNSTLKGTLNVSAGLGATGSAQPIAISMNGGVALIAEVAECRIDKCISSKFLDFKITDIDTAIDLALEAKTRGSAVSIGVLCNAVHLLERLLERNVIPDTLTDQTSPDDPVMSYCPHEMSYEYSKVLRLKNPGQYVDYASKSMYRHMQLMQELKIKGAITFDYGNNIRARAEERGLKDAFNFHGFIPAYIRPLFFDGQEPFRWAVLSGDQNDIAITDNLIMKMFPQKKELLRWMKEVNEKIAFNGLLTRICWLGQREREEAGLALNELVRTEKVRAPIAISLNHLDTRSKVSPGRKTDTMIDCPILSALVNTACGANWVSLQYCGIAGIDYSILAGMVIVADGTADAAVRLSRVLRNNIGVRQISHAVAVNKIPRQNAKKYKFNLNGRLILKEEGVG